MTRTTLIAHRVSIVLMAVLVLVATGDGFAQSYAGLHRWALEHGLKGWKADSFPLLVDLFIAVGELGLFALALEGHRLTRRGLSWVDIALPFSLAAGGWGVSLAFNVGAVRDEFADQVTAAVAPVASMLGLLVMLRTVHRLVSRNENRDTDHVPEVTAEPIALTDDRSPWGDQSPADEQPPTGVESWGTPAVSLPPVTGLVTGNPGLAWRDGKVTSRLQITAAEGGAERDRSLDAGARPVANGAEVVASTGHPALEKVAGTGTASVLSSAKNVTGNGVAATDASPGPDAGDRDRVTGHERTAEVTAIGDRSPKRRAVPVKSEAEVVTVTTRGRRRDRLAPTEVTSNGNGGRDLDQVIAAAQDVFADLIADGKVPSQNAIRSQLHVGPNRARQVKEALSKSA